MAGTNHPDFMNDQYENSGHSNDDFEKLDAPGSGFEHDTGDTLPAGRGTHVPERSQDSEVSTTTDIAGEDEAEEDRYAGGPSEAEAHSSEPLFSLEDNPFQVQPSAPVPDSREPLIDFLGSNISADPDILSSFDPIAPPSHFHESVPTSSDVGLPQHDFGESERESKQVSEHMSSSEETAHTQGSWLKGVDPRVKDLIYWRNVKNTGVVFGSMMVVLLSLAIFSLVSVVAYLSLAALTVTFTFVVYKKVMGAVQKSTDGHPFKFLLEKDISLSEEKLKSIIDTVIKNVNTMGHEVRRLFLIEDIVDSIKFGLLLWALTYIGSWFNGMSLIILAIVLLFTLPKVYETYQVQIDNYIALAKGHICNVLNIVQSKLPFLKKKDKAQ